MNRRKESGKNTVITSCKKPEELRDDTISTYGYIYDNADSTKNSRKYESLNHQMKG